MTAIDIGMLDDRGPGHGSQRSDTNDSSDKGNDSSDKGTGDDGSHDSKYKDVIKTILDETRMVLPGIQTLFGFQLIAVFNQSFDKLSDLDRLIHMVALVFTMIAVGLLLAPAAYDRQCRYPETFSKHFAKVATRFLGLGMVPFVISMCLDLYIVASLILHNKMEAMVLSLVMLTFFFLLWFCFPLMDAKAQH